MSTKEIEELEAKINYLSNERAKQRDKLAAIDLKRNEALRELQAHLSARVAGEAH